LLEDSSKHLSIIPAISSTGILRGIEARLFTGFRYCH
jgi:hypothetical protein